MLSLGLIIVLAILFGLVVCCMVATVLAPGHLRTAEEGADTTAEPSGQAVTGAR